MAEAGLYNVKFAQTDIAEFSSDTPFDAVAGRFILQFLPDPVGVLLSLSEQVTPGGIIAFQEGSWAPFVLLSAHLPLWSRGVSLLHEVSARSGVTMEMGPALVQLHGARRVCKCDNGASARITPLPDSIRMGWLGRYDHSSDLHELSS
jgi:hypothetical protein